MITNKSIDQRKFINNWLEATSIYANFANFLLHFVIAYDSFLLKLQVLFFKGTYIYFVIHNSLLMFKINQQNP